jgi:hypothetical protein
MRVSVRLRDRILNRSFDNLSNKRTREVLEKMGGRGGRGQQLALYAGSAPEQHGNGVANAKGNIMQQSPERGIADAAVAPGSRFKRIA